MAHWLLLHQICNLLSLCRLLTSNWYSFDLSSSVAIGRCIYLRRYGHDLRGLFQLCSSRECLPFFEHNTSINASTQMFTCIGSRYMVFIDPSHVWIASGSVDFRYFHIRCLLPDDATTFTAVAALCISFILAVDLNLPSHCAIVYIDVTSTPCIGGCSIVVALMSNYSSVALLHHSQNLPSNGVE